MTQITASQVKELREKSGAGMLDCKKALSESAGDMDAAVDYLRKKGLSTAAKKSDRAAAEGLVNVAAEGNSAITIELNAETDFVARNEQFQKFLSDVSELALKNNIETIEALKAMDLNGKTVEASLTELVATIGEHMNLRRIARLSVENGVVATYVHNSLTPNNGKIGVLVALESTGDADKLNDLGRKIAMHIAATSPESVDIESLDQDLVARERAVHSDKAKQSGKPENIIEKIVEGSIRKFYEHVVLLEQTFVVDGENKISVVLENAEKELGAPVKITNFVRFQLGEGVEKKADDFADEVAKMAAC